jgi:Uma2 family endonuclease
VQISLDPPYLIVRPGLGEEEFYRLAGEDTDWEYLDGRIIMHSPASDRHEDIFCFLLTLLRSFLDETRGATVRGSRYPMRLDAHWSPEPDILVVRESRRHLMTPQRLEGPADMVIEIASESDPGLDYREKLPRYREAGIDEIWIVNPFERRVLAETKTAGAYNARSLSSGRLASTVVPGFSIEVSWLWQEELPSTVRCLREMQGRDAV